MLKNGRTLAIPPNISATGEGVCNHRVIIPCVSLALRTIHRPLSRPLYNECGDEARVGFFVWQAHARTKKRHHLYHDYALIEKGGRQK